MGKAEWKEEEFLNLTTKKKIKGSNHLRSLDRTTYDAEKVDIDPGGGKSRNFVISNTEYITNGTENDY